VFGSSSGAALALDAANVGVPIQRLILYEAPFIVDDGRPPIASDFLARLTELIAKGRRGDAVKMFMKLMDVPAPVVFVMQLLPLWRKLKTVAHTLPYDISIVQDHERGRPLRRDRWSAVSVPTLVMNGGKSPGWMHTAMRSLAAVLPDAQYRTLAGQTHMLRAKAIAPVITNYALNDLATSSLAKES
jgi:pimeloyl-ACP methyl ester carboxylesterase